MKNILAWAFMVGLLVFCVIQGGFFTNPHESTRLGKLPSGATVKVVNTPDSIPSGSSIAAYTKDNWDSGIYSFCEGENHYGYDPGKTTHTTVVLQ